MKKIFSMLLFAIVSLTALCSCSMGGEEEETSSVQSGFEATKKITVVSREEGAGLRSIFADLFDFLDDDKDLTFSGVSVKESAADIKATVSSDEYAIGYLPFTAVDQKVKTLKVNGVAPTTESVKNEKYAFKHTIYAVTKEDASEGALDFVNFLVSEKARDILRNEGYITSEKKNEFTSKKPEGTLKISASASVEPAISKVKEEYAKYNDKLKIEITRANSKTSIESLKDKDNLAIITRELSDSEEEGHKETEICEDAIAVVVNTKNTLDNITSDEVKKIYKGEITKWSDIIK